MTLKKNGRIGIVGVAGDIKVKWHRDLPSSPKSAILTRKNGKWYVVFHVEVGCAAERKGVCIGIDVGLASLAALSNGELIGRPNWTKQASKGLRRRQRSLARCKLGSKRRSKAKLRLAGYQERIANRRRDHLHKVSADLASRFVGIGYEELNIKGLASGMLAREVNDAAWAQLISNIRYKAEKAGGRAVGVDPRGTSRTCPGCGAINAKALSERVHGCDCGVTLDRDVAAAQIVLFRAFGIGPGIGLQSLTRAVA
jgi:putative transposase